MKTFMINYLVRAQFAMTSRNRVLEQTKKIQQSYEKLAEGLSHEIGSRCVLVPPMLGIDENMRNWSFYMILEHNTIVNRTITAIIEQLFQGESLSGVAAINPKTAVMPSKSPGVEQIQMFKQSIKNHLMVVQELGKLRGTKTAPHPIFGAFDAHKWQCMFPFHLKLHYRQADFVIRMAQRE
jgi:hypothetical protein